ncbi:MAG: hypothetical protein AAFV53_34075 [Myxococcota bacterium]
MTADVQPGQFRRASTIDRPATYRDGRWQLFEPQPPVSWTLCGSTWLLRPGLTFTPYANPTPCNAHCAFCSEELLRRDGDRLTAKTPIGDHDRYFDGLRRAWAELSGFPMGLSLSGLEATSDPAWMLRLLAMVQDHPGLFPSQVLYTNGSGLLTHPELIDALAKTRFDRIELSRCHFDANRNQQIMRFNRNEPVHTASGFDALLSRLNGRVAVKLSCILNRMGVQDIDGVEAYIDHAVDAGVNTIVFRELSQLGDAYHLNRETDWIAANRVSVRALMEQIQPDPGPLRPGWAFVGATSGYYYYNEIYERQGVQIILEVSSYVAHRAIQQTGILQKLVFHSTGDLCGDWVPNALRIGNYFG